MAACARRVARLLAGPLRSCHAQSIVEPVGAAVTQLTNHTHLSAQHLTASQHSSLVSNSGKSSGLLPASCRAYATQPSVTDQVDRINELFAEAREEIESAKEDAETVYFNESAEVAKEAVQEVLSQWDALLGQLGDAERQKLQRSMGLKMEQLKAELKELEELHA